MRLRGWIADRLAGQSFVERSLDVIGRGRDIVRIRRGFAIDRSLVNNFSFGTNYDHVRRILRSVEGFCYVAFRIEQ